MAKISIWNISKANELIDTATSVLAPALEKANIKTVTVDGKAVAVSQAPLAAQISALIATQPPASGQQNEAELMVTNSTLAAQLEKQSVELAQANTAVGTLQGNVRDLTARAESAEASVSTLTAENGQLGVQLKAANSEFQRVSGSLSAVNAELSRICVSAHVLDLRDENNVPLGSSATQDQKIAAANLIPAGDKIKAYEGAVNSAVSRIGVQPSSVPGAPGSASAGGSNLAENAVLTKLNSVTDPVEKTRLRRENMKQIRAGFKAQTSTT